ncbi:hypothetical protein [Kribbella ginsengisoli]|uniref:Uncharacterized protein n=1 Tax=Kribbella ginsengisoli TaxID=363865 RepID=A0ABP6WAI1_9ACTN
MTPFMLSVQALLDGEAAPVAGVEDSVPMPIPVATDVQVIVRSLAEQLVSEANAILRPRGDVIELVDQVGPGELTFTMTYHERAAQVRTVMSGHSALVSLILSGQQNQQGQQPRRLSSEDELQGLVLTLIEPQRVDADRQE